MYKTPAQAREYANAFAPLADKFRERAAIVLCAPFIDLVPLREELRDLDPAGFIDVGAQDVFWEPEGAYTGEISAAMLGGESVDYCIVGHSERRRLFGDTDETVARKVTALLGADIVPIVCVGETLEEHQTGRRLDVVAGQIRACLGHLSDEQRAGLVIAYEPIWAIGTGMCDTPQGADETIGFIRTLDGGLEDATILYGGSMKADNAAYLCAEQNVDGGLVGSASLDPAGFATLIDNALRGIDGASA
ncbi:MAG: triose-phosphate isomerase [Candidatus Eremiobacteraeota bacterium]|nr:triose-phosphate isomerase [Candidatus Eremiobacteraeota bacterium]MBV8366898.1 triose-phosphate isomerase [Candidatus Eremiobacteraeota bacterium]